MEALMQRGGTWIAWGVFAVVAGLYAWELARELSRGAGAFEIGANAFLAVVTLFVIGLVVAVVQRHQQGELTGWTAALLHWVPRAAALLFVALLALLSLDVLGDGRSFLETLAALAIHLVPAVVLLGAVLLAWRWEWIGAALFAAWAVVYLIGFSPRGFPLSVYVLMVGLPLAIAVLFLLEWRWGRG